ncbi:ATP-binding cassette domain-containing protein [Campylobacter insulaenigrae]|uniref:ATP-binding cassette domain-containing protein n=1 Tax=Campylobacter insulaenigrae TaxID=260714 RepID=UPI0021539DE8|nr:ATP-binding cassette domain-containing protein [Campylobacter insulaenigrae]MCR6594893.1 ATP-binding cassette domain-containing protein [Campylobacter insulaenigrae]
MICVENLNLNFKQKKLLQNVNFELKDEKSLAIVGKSGIGKSLLLKSLIRLFDKNYTLQAKTIKFDDYEVLKLNDKELNFLRMKVNLLFQDVYGSFYPFVDIGSYFNIVIKTHTNLNTKQIKEKAFYFFECLGLKNHDLLWHSFIYQLSGGMARRVQIALALLSGSQYLLCDEITSSLDVQNECKIIDILKSLKANFKNIIYVSHDLNLVKQLCDEVLVFEENDVICQYDIEEFLKFPKSQYAQKLLNIESACF